jgi:hypothetical protein
MARQKNKMRESHTRKIPESHVRSRWKRVVVERAGNPKPRVLMQREASLSKTVQIQQEGHIFLSNHCTFVYPNSDEK